MQKISLFVILSIMLTMPMAFGQEELGAQKIGVQQVRVRDINGLARIEIELDKLNLLNDTKTKTEIFSKLKMIGFSEIEINPNGYVSGSLNVILEN